MSFEGNGVRIDGKGRCGSTMVLVETAIL